MLTVVLLARFNGYFILHYYYLACPLCLDFITSAKEKEDM